MRNLLCLGGMDAFCNVYLILTHERTPIATLIASPQSRICYETDFISCSFANRGVCSDLPGTATQMSPKVTRGH